MSDDLLIIALVLMSLAAPGLAGFGLVRWRNASSPDPWPAWAGWGVGAGGTVALCAATWAYALAKERGLGSDDGSVPMAAAMLVASVVVNGLAGVVLAFRRPGEE